MGTSVGAVRSGDVVRRRASSGSLLMATPRLSTHSALHLLHKLATRGRWVIPLVFLFSVSSMAFSGDSPRRPNIVFILTDDQGYGDISAHGNPILKTPNLDRIHREGVRFTDFHVSPTCAPTRSALLTGRHEFKNGVTHTILERERLTLN